MPGRLSALAFDRLRDLRTAVLWTLGPADLVLRRWRGDGDLPPLWLRRHAGPVRNFRSAARAMAELMERLVVLPPESRVLEIGCGCGAMAPHFVRRLGHEATYVGFDVHAPSIDWCRRKFAHERRFRFEVAQVASPYGSRSSRSPVTTYRFPVADGSADLVLAKSVFTHLLESEARHYLREIRRTLHSAGSALITAFLFARPQIPAAFPFPTTDVAVRWRRRFRAEAAVAFDRVLFEAMIAESGLTVRTMVTGYWPGTAAVPRGQDVLVLAPV